MFAGYGQPYVSTSYSDEDARNSPIYADPVPDITDMPLNNPSTINSMKEYTKEFLSGLCIEGDSWVPYG